MPLFFKLIFSYSTVLYDIKKSSLKAVLIFQQLNAKECPNHNTTAAFNLNNSKKL